MASKRDSQFGLQVNNVPLINIRFEFNDLLALFRKEQFRDQFRGPHRPIRTNYLTWHGRRSTLLTQLLRESIVGLESAVSGAVCLEALARGTMTDEILEATKNPYSLARLGTAHCVFNALPALIDAQFALESRDPALWSRVRIFYREVRNPIFHAYDVGESDPDPVWRVLEFVWEVYEWLNRWHSVELLLSGVIQWAPGTLERIASIATLPDPVIEQFLTARSLPPAFRLPAEQVVPVNDVTGLSLPAEDMADITARKPDGTFINLVMSPHAAMKLLGFLDLARRHRGWQIPDPLW